MRPLQQLLDFIDTVMLERDLKISGEATTRGPRSDVVSHLSMY
jgi:hypothetical protein